MAGSDHFGWVGATIDGQFAVEAVAGEGGFGVVYRGTHLAFEAPIAVKCLKIPSDLGEDGRAALLARFRAEARLLHRLSRLTTGVAQALHVGAATAPSGRWAPYIVMEWLDGETLESDLRRRSAAGIPPRGIDEAIALLTPAAEALAIAHGENITHRDVKPANLFLVQGRSSAPVKVVDFGIAKVFAETPSLSAALAQTGDGPRAFSPQYAAPEQFNAKYGGTGPWTDVFATALVLLEVASGRRALSGSDVMQLYVAAADEQHRPGLRRSGIAASPELEAVFLRALAVRPALRYANLDEMWTALRAAQATSRPGGQATSRPGGRAGTTQVDGATAEARGDAAATAPMSTAPTGENRVCTIVVVDLTEVTGLAARAGAEVVKDVLHRCAQVVQERVEKRGGLVEAQPGDHIMAAFGLPRATESDAERAVMASLEIRAALARLPLPRAARPLTRLAPRVGIATGRVFAEGSTSPARRNLGLVGDALHVAARLVQAAPPGAIAVSREAYRQIAGRFNVDPLPAVVAEPAGEPLPSYRVLGPTAFRHGLAVTGFHGLETALVGRAAERRRLLDAFETATTEACAKLVTVVGPAGVGRSRLLADFYAALSPQAEQIMPVTAQGSPLEQERSYGLAASLLRRRFALHEDDGPDVVKRKLRRGVRWLRLKRRGAAGDDLSGDELDDALGQIALLLGTQPTGGTEAPTGDEASGIARHRIAAAVARLLRFAAARFPVVCFCDDLQWSDGASLDLLDAILARVEGVPVLVVASARPELFELRPRWGHGRAGHERIDVAPLPRRHVEEMARDRLRLVSDLGPELVGLLADRAEGNPLTLVETLHLLVDAGVIETPPKGPWRVRAERLGALSLPATVQGIVQARLDRLDPEALDLLERAAVVGRTFWEGTVDRLRREGGRTPTESTAELLERLRDRELVRAREPSKFPGEREYIFAESAAHEVAYEMLSAKLRRALHRGVAAWMAERPRDRASAALLALHYDRGGDAARAAAEHARAGAHAAALGENAESLRHLERARQLHDESAEAEALDGEGDGPGDERRVARWTERVRLRLDLGDVLRRIGRVDEAERVYEEARDLIPREERRREGRREARIDPAEALLREAWIDLRLAQVHRLRGATPAARALVERAIGRAAEAGAAREMPAMYALLAMLYRRELRVDASFQAVLDGLRACRKVDRRDERWAEDVAQLLFAAGTALYGRRRWIGAERSYRQALRAVSEARQPHLAGVALNGIAAARLARGELRGTRELFARSLKVKERVGDLHQIAIACNNLAEVSLRLADVAWPPRWSTRAGASTSASRSTRRAISPTSTATSARRCAPPAISRRRSTPGGGRSRSRRRRGACTSATSPPR
ncbi:protein kinase [Sorangium cellulosum]|uniref:Protein kinase n=1 Tax=Sorangium cellulosum TaxID=56 RepID=A0A2L0EK69_SORCE|nr:AAA family ATPase [Sorangium cellulosum]AUX39693.1 protein kinase [Sorangium cellulosum]